MAFHIPLERILAAPRPTAAERARVESTLRLILAMAVLAAASSLVVSWLLAPGDWVRPALLALAMLPLGHAALRLRSKDLRGASCTVVANLIVFTTLGLIVEGVWSAVQGGYMLAIISAGLLLGARPAVATLALSVCCLVGLAVAGEFGLLPEAVSRSRASNWWMAGVILTFGGVLLAVAARRSRESLVSLRQSGVALRRSNQELRASRDRYEALAEHARDLVSELDADGRFLYVNQAFQQVLGFAPADLIGSQLSELSDPETRAASSRVFDANGGQPDAPQLFHALHRDGSSRYLEHSAARYRTPAGELRTTLISRDVTERIQSEERVRQLEERMARAHRTESLGLLAGGIAHDFNNLLVGILANAEEALFELEEGDAAREYVQDIARAGEGAADLVRQLLAYTGKGRIEVGPTDLSLLASETARMLRIDTRAEISLELGSQPVWVRADAPQIRQIILNLLVNAIEALGGAGQVRLRTGLRQLDAETLSRCSVALAASAGEYAFLEVQDTGCGMSAELLENVFDPFYTTKSGGRGLGLSTVLGVVRSHRGALDVTTRVGGGTTILVLLPALDFRVRDASEASALAPRTGDAAPPPALADAPI